MFTPSELADIKRRFEDGETQAEVAASFGITTWLLRERLKSSGHRKTATIRPIRPVEIASEEYALAK